MAGYKFFMYVIFNNVCSIGTCYNCIFNINDDCLMRNVPYSYNSSNLPNNHIFNNIKNICTNSKCHNCIFTETSDRGTCSIINMINKLFIAWESLNESRRYYYMIQS